MQQQTGMMSSQQKVVKQSTSVQQQSSSFSMQQSSVQQQSQTQTSVTRQVQQGTQRVQGPTQMVPVGLPAGASPPVFEQIFQNARFAQGGDALFEGKVQGSPKPTVTWTRRGQQISSGNKYEVSHDEISGVVTLLIRAIGPGDEGEYTCTAANQYGEAICTVYIQPEAAYMMQQQRQQMQQSSVQSQMHVQKQQQMQLMQNGYSESFRVDTFEHRILHEVEFRQSLCMRLEGEADMGGVTIQGPPAAPQLQQKPRSTKVTDGGNATFTVHLMANPSPRVIWFKNGARLQQSEKYLITASAGQATLVIKNVSSADNGYYTMLAENRSGCSVASAQLAVVAQGEDVTNGMAPEVIRPTSTVEPMEVETDESGKTLEPKFALVPRDRESQEGKMVRFDCRVTGRPYPEVTWFLNGQTIIDDATHKVLVNEAGNHSLMITEVSLADNGTITCVARNKSGETNFQVALHVLEREQMVSPKFVERFQQGQVKEGETVVLHARAVGTPMPTMSWQKDGVAIENSASIQIQSDGQGSSNLQILSASVADAGWFSCNAGNVAGSTSTRARLHVVADKSAPPMPQRPNFPKPTTVIPPQPAHQPEIINLRPVERAHHQPRAVEEEQSTEAPKFTVPLRDIDLEEGKRAHFEAKLTPVGDATLNVEWLIDGRPLAASSRATTTYRFGYVALDILNVIKADTGVYTCRASNVMGQAEVSANLRISENSIIDTSSQHTDAMKQINYLEQQTTYQKNVSIEEAINIKPNFVKSLANLGDVSEGKYAHFEAQLHPVSDPFMRIEWFKDGKTITASSRINVIYNFGYVALNIMHLRPEDSGTYSVRATNKAGECTCTATIKVVAMGGVTGDLGIPEQSAYIKSVEEMEAYRLQMLSKQTTEFVQSTVVPTFKSELKDTSAREGGYAHFEARLEPIGDPGLKVEWFKDGRPLEASARITSFYNFGYVALTIKQLIIQDAGTYICVASNTLGKAQVQCTLVIISRNEKEVESHYSEAVQKMEYMEDSSRYQRTETEETTVTIAPKFVGQMKGTNKIVEGQKAHFEVRLEPQSDSTMTVEWYFNSQVIMSASRIKLYNDFGYVSLDISDVRQTDSGQYTVVARNALGEAQLSTQMTVETRSSIDYTTMHEVTMTKTTAMERRAHQEPQYEIDEHTKSKPAFNVMLADPKPVSEGKNIHLEARLEPVGDPTMRVDWFFNGKPLTVGSRFKTYFDFGFVALDILSAYSNDTGEYTCRAENALGSAHTSAQVQVLGSNFIESETMHSEAMDQISYLENRNQRAAQEETDISQPPTFAKSLKNIETIEGTNIHLEARLQPVGDSSMRIEWFFNDEPLKVGHRFRPAYDFDYVALDLLSVYPYDSGIYTCRATNSLGQAVSSASVKITEGTGIVITNEQTTMTMEQLTMLEERHRYSRTETVEESTKQAPVFTTALKNLEILEGQRAHFEVRLIPTSDPTMKIEWFHDNKPIKSGSRFTEYNDFGFVALDIMYAYAEDSGTYTCVATNCLGQATSSCTLLCHTKESILVDTMNVDAMSKITQLEHRSSRTVTAEEAVMQAPVFTAPMKDQNLMENAPLHFEARLIPVGDPDLKVEWFKNGIPIQQANRITTMHDFGYVALDMKYVNAEDSGTYTCRATNRLGQAVTSATLVVTSKESLLMESQHTEALEKLRYLEDSSKYSKSSTEETIITTAPRFTVQLSGLTQLWEGQSAHVECRLEPYPDPSMKVEWFHNGSPLNIGHRFRTMYDFGFCAMDILSAVAEDSGTYEVRATNRIGTATSSITIEIKARSDFILDTQHPEAMSKLARLEQKAPSQLPEDIQMIEKPNFGRPLRNLENLIEGQAMHMEATLTPVNDATMKVEWFFNGQPIPSGHRFRTTYDFGFVALDVLYAYPEDSGTYMCKATNAAGQAVTSCTVKITEVEGMQTDGDEERMRKIKALEASGERREEMTDLPLQKPVFTTPLQNQESIVEGDRVHLECRLEPINDPNLHVEWYVNGVEIKAGHRFRTTHDFGYVALDVLYAYAEDSGTYLCKATNKLGEAVNSCSVTVSAGQTVVMHSQVPKGMQQMDFSQQMEQTLKKYCTEIMLTQEDIYDIAKRQPPRFVTHIKDQMGLKEMEGAKFDCQLAPVGDPNMKVEWFFNGRPLPYKNRFTPIYDFGYVALQMNWVFGEDSGEYLCRATNKYGMDETRANLKSTARPGVIYDSQLPVGKHSLEKIRELESQWDKVPEAADEVDKARSQPEILLKPENVNCQEGEWARFSVRVSGHPRPRVMWIVNGNTAMSGNRFKIWYDGIYHLDIPKTRQYDSGKIEVMCRNACGQAYGECALEVKPRMDDYRAVLKNSPKPWYDYELKTYQKDRQANELDRVYEERVGTETTTHESKFGDYVARTIETTEDTEWQKIAKQKNAGEKIKQLELDQKVKSKGKDVRQFAHPALHASEQSLAKGMASKYEQSLTEETQMSTEITEEQMALYQQRQEQIMQERRRQEIIRSKRIEERQRQQTEMQEQQNVTMKAQQEMHLKQQQMTQKHMVQQQKIDEQKAQQTVREMEPAESAVHAKEIYTNTQRQTQKEVQGDLEIHRKITATERTEMEHSAKTTERIVSGDVKPAKPPYFTKKIQPCRSFEREGAKFEIEFDGDPMPTIQWYREDFPITSSPDFQIHTFGDKSILQIREVFMEDSGVFAVVAENRGGRAKCSANLVVEERRQSTAGIVPPSFITTIQDVRSKPELLVRLDAKIYGTAPIDIYWLKNGRKLALDAHIKFIIEEDVYTLLILECVPDDSGKYECVAVNKAGEARCQADVIVAGPRPVSMIISPETPSQVPTVIENLKPQVVVEGQSAVFECCITAVPPPQIQWLKDQQPIKHSKYFSMTSEGDNHTLNISECFPEDEGSYQCVISNSMGQMTLEAPLQIVVPEIKTNIPALTPLQAVTVWEGEGCRFMTQVTGNPTPQVQWYREGAMIPHSRDFEMFVDGNTAVLDIKLTYPEDSGTFTCRATNVAGQAETSAMLTVQSKLTS